MNIWDNVTHFEELVAEYCGSKYAVAIDSCTNAIFLCLKYLQGTAPVVVPAKTYISVPCAVINAGYKVNFQNIKWFGQYQLNPYPIIDSAQLFTSNMYTPRTYCCVSFHFKKTLAIGRGGMILTDNKEFVDWCKAARYHGRETLGYNDITDINVIGWHMYMTPDQAVRGIEQFYKTSKVNTPCGGGSEGFKIDLSQLNGFKKYTI